MNRRVSVPAADDLFRPTVVPEPDAADPSATTESAQTAAPASPDAPAEARAHSGRVRHDEKMTVYVTPDELLDLEQARLTLRRAGMAVDRGRLVRAAVALALADLDERGADSDLVRRLRRE